MEKGRCKLQSDIKTIITDEDVRSKGPKARVLHVSFLLACSCFCQRLDVAQNKFSHVPLEMFKPFAKSLKWELPALVPAKNVVKAKNHGSACVRSHRNQEKKSTSIQSCRFRDLPPTQDVELMVEKIFLRPMVMCIAQAL